MNFAEEARSIQRTIAQHEVDLKIRQDTLARIKNENTLKNERLSWLMESEKQLDYQFANLTNQFKAMRRNQQGASTSKSGGETHQLSLQKLDRLLNAPSYDKSFLDIFQLYLEKENRQYLRFSIKKTQSLDEDQFINPFPVISVKPHINGIKAEIISLRLDEITKFLDVKQIVFYFWLLDKRLGKEGASDLVNLNELLLTDDQLAAIPIDDNVFKFFYHRGQSNISQQTLMLRMKDQYQPNINFVELQSIRIMGAKGEAKMDSFMASKCFKVKISPYKSFFEYYTGLKYFIDEHEIQNEEELRLQNEMDDKSQKKKNQNIETGPTNEQSLENEALTRIYEVTDTHCCVLSAIMITLIFTLTQFSGMLPSYFVNTKTKAMMDLLSLGRGGDFLQIQNEQDFWQYLQLYIGPCLLNSEANSNFFRENNELVGVIRLRQFKVIEEDCQQVVYPFQKNSCYARQFNQDSEYKKNAGANKVTSDEWKQYRTKEELNSEYEPIGRFSTYGGGGYVKDFQRDMSSEVFLKQTYELMSQQFFDKRTAAISINFISYTPNSNMWYYVYLLLERNIQNALVPNIPTILIFIPNMYEGAKGQQNFSLDMVRIFLSFILTLYNLYRFKQQKWRWRYMVLEIGALDLSATCMTITASNKNLNSKELLNREDFIDLYHEASYYNITFVIQGTNILMIFFRLSVLFKFNSRVNLVYQTFNRALVSILSFILLILPNLVSFALIFQVMMSQYYQGFTTFQGSLCNLVLMAIGIFPMDNPNSYKSSGPTAFMVIYAFFIYFFIISIFQAFILEAYFSVIRSFGYPQKEEIEFKFKYIPHWLFSWILCWFHVDLKKLNHEHQEARAETNRLEDDDNGLIQAEMEEEMKVSIVEQRIQTRQPFHFN